MPIARIFFGNPTATAAATAPFNSFTPVPPAPLQRSVASQVLGSSMALLAAVVVTAPFFNPSNAVAKGLAPAAPDQVYINVPLLDYQSTPFVQRDWSSPVRVRVSAPDQLHTNIGSFTNPVPFGPFDWSTAARQKPQPDQPPRNPNLFSEVPFAGQVSPRPFDIPGHATFAPPLNLSLTATVQVPFAQLDWSKPQRLTGNLYPAPQPYNRGIYTNPIPFGPFDYQKARLLPREPQPPQGMGYNFNLYRNNIPFGPFDYQKAAKPAIIPPQLQPALTHLISAVVAAPFYQTDWPKARYLNTVAPDQAHTDINKFTNPLPFAQLDWSKPSTVAGVPAAPLPLNLSLSVVVQSPFYQTVWPVSVSVKAAAVDQFDRNSLIYSEVPFFQTDWPKAFDLVGLPPGSGPLNVNLFTNPYPFAQYDWSKPQQSPNWQGAKSSDFNLSLTSAPVAPPFVQLDWSKPVNVAPVRPDQGAPNIALLVTPPPPSPFYQLDWSKPVQVAGLLPAPLPVNLGLFPPPEPVPPVFDTPPVPDNGGVGHKPRKKAKALSAPVIRRGVYISVAEQIERESKRQLATLRDTTAISVRPALDQTPVSLSGTLDKLGSLSKLGRSIAIDHAARAIRLEQIEKSRAQAWKRKQDEEALIALLLF